MLTALLLAVTSSEAAIECRESMDANVKAYWRWRLVDGKKCWFASKEVQDKSNLYWPKEGDETVIERKFYTREELEQMVPKDSTFEERWNDLFIEPRKQCPPPSNC